MASRPDPQRAQIMRQRCNRVFRGKSIHDVVGAVEMLTADTVVSGLPGVTEEQALSAADAIAADIRTIIRERFAATGKGH